MYLVDSPLEMTEKSMLLSTHSYTKITGLMSDNEITGHFVSRMISAVLVSGTFLFTSRILMTMVLETSTYGRF